MSNLVKCQNCGKEIKNEDKRTEIFCSYCGAKVQIVTSADGNIDNNKIDNYLFLSREALKVKNTDEAYNYVNRVLEVDVKNINAWYLKMEILGQMSILKDLKCEEVIAAGNKVIEFSDSLEIKLRVYRYYLDKCLSDLKFCTFSLQNVESIKKIHEANLLKDIFNAGEMTLVADVVRECVVKQEAKILSLRLEVPILLIKENEDFAFLVAEIAKQWVYYQNALNARYNVYDRSMTESALEEYKSRLNLIKQGLPEKYINVIDENSLTSENKSADKNGCYIATSIYGSYDCPQVWTLRRFRDNVLDEYLLGRIFIKIYYAISPVMVKLFGETTLFKLMFNSILNRIVSNLNNKGFEDTPYNDKY